MAQARTVGDDGVPRVRRSDGKTVVDTVEIYRMCESHVQRPLSVRVRSMPAARAVRLGYSAGTRILRGCMASFRLTYHPATATGVSRRVCPACRSWRISCRRTSTISSLQWPKKNG